MSLNNFRICKPRNIIVWTLVAAALPIAVSVFFIFLTPGIFAVTSFSSEQLILRVLAAFFNTCLVAGITEELIFRGFIMGLLELRWGKRIAIIAPSVLFGLIHIFNTDNPNIVDISMLLIAGTSVGIMFSMIACQSGSIWPSAVVHGIWNLIIIGGILEIGIEPGKSIFVYTLKSNSVLVTGGAFGIESSLPAIVGYCITIIFAWILYRRTATS
jgi:membrane protease YdiL (CAAX protease family)